MYSFVVVSLVSLLSGASAFAMQQRNAADFGNLMLTVMALQAANGEIVVDVPKVENQNPPVDFKQQNPAKLKPKHHHAGSIGDRSRRGAHRGFAGASNRTNSK